MTPYYQDDLVTVLHGDCLDVLRELPDNSVDAVVTDPPYGLEFMGKEWDSPWKVGDDINTDAGLNAIVMADGYERLPRPSFTGSTNPKCLNCGGTRRGRRDGTAARKVCVCADAKFPNVRAAEMAAFQQWCELWATECLRVLKPGGHLLAFGGTRTWHRLAVAIEDAGFEMRDSIAWLYGSGFPKSLDVSKAIDKRPGVMQHPEFAADLRAAMAKRGYTNTFDVAEKVIGRRTGAVANWQKYQFPEAKWWPALRDLLGMDGRKWDPVIAEAERALLVSRNVTDRRRDGTVVGLGHSGNADITAPATPEAEQWAGWGTALKPAFEPIVVARKPLSGTVAANVLQHGTGALNIAATRIGPQRDSSGSTSADSSDCTCPSLEGDRTNRTPNMPHPASSVPAPEGRSAPPPSAQSGESGCQRSLGFPGGCQSSPCSCGEHAQTTGVDGLASAQLPPDADRSRVRCEACGRIRSVISTPHPQYTAPSVEGRWPANVILSADQAAALDQMSGERPGAASQNHNSTAPKFESGKNLSGSMAQPSGAYQGFNDSGGASRFFLTVEDECAVHGIRRCTICLRPLPIDSLESRFTYTAKAGSDERITHNGISHATVKPLSLMRYLVRLVTPPGGTILEPFAGSGTTVEAAILEGFRCIAIEREADYLPLITQRIHRRRDPVAYLTEGGHDLGLFGDGDEVA